MISYILTLDKQLLYQLLFQLINVFILCLILSRVLYKPVLNFLNKRGERIKNEIELAAAKMEEADKLKLEYEMKLKNTEKEKTEILEEALKLAKISKQDIIAEAKEEAEAIRQRAMLDIQREEERAKDEIRKQIIEVSTLIASKLIEKTIDDETQNKIIDEAISGLEEINV